MAKSAAELSPLPANDRLMIFEQPLNERMRTFLRIEFLAEQTRFHAQQPTDFGARAAVTGLLEMLTILGRGDVRADVLKELDRHADSLGRYRTQPGVDPRRLTTLIQDITELKQRLTETGSQLTNPLKECEFLNGIRHRSAIPGGTCIFDLPDYGYWLHLPHEEHAEQLETWMNRLKPLCDAVSEVLWLTREATAPTERTANGGLYQTSLDRAEPWNRGEHWNLVRVLLPAKGGIFPEISAGQHRFTVRFVRWRGVDARPSQVTENVRFLLSLC